MKRLWLILIMTCLLMGKTYDTPSEQIGAPGHLLSSEFYKYSNLVDLYPPEQNNDFTTKIDLFIGTKDGSVIGRFRNPETGVDDSTTPVKLSEVNIPENDTWIYADSTSLPLISGFKRPDMRAHFYSLAIQGTVIAGGALLWRYTERWTGKFAIENEGLFRSDSYNGGSDKLGHAYAWNIFTRSLISVYERHGFPRNQAVFWGFTIPVVNGALVELLDGFTDYNASTEDILFNIIGSGSAAFLFFHPAIDEIFHLDVSY